MRMAKPKASCRFMCVPPPTNSLLFFCSSLRRRDPLRDGALGTVQGLLHMYLSGTIVGVANAAVFHPVDSIRIRYFFLPRSKKSVHLDDIRGVSFWKGLGTVCTLCPVGENVSLIPSAIGVMNGTLLNSVTQGLTCSPRPSNRWRSTPHRS